MRTETRALPTPAQLEAVQLDLALLASTRGRSSRRSRTYVPTGAGWAHRSKRRRVAR